MTSITQISQQMKSALSESADRAAEQAGLIQRQRKVTSRNLGRTLVLGWWQDPEMSLEGLTQMGKSVGLTITPQGLDQRFNATTAAYLERLLRAVVQVKLEVKRLEIPAMAAFSQVYVEDSSIVTFLEPIEEVWRGLGGKGPKSAVKLQTRLDLKQGHLDGPHLVNGRTHDRVAAQAHAAIGQQALHLRDLGYWKLTDWESANQEGYYLLSRMKTSTHFWVEDQPFDCFTWCKGIAGSDFDVPILLGKKLKTAARLMGRRTTAAIAAERRRKVKRAAKERGKTVSQERLVLCEWTLVVTNATEELISTREAFIWLGVRWQVELLFKLWKSVGQIDKSRSCKPWRQLCEFYAKLIAMTLQHWLFIPAIWPFPDRSLTKAAQAIRIHVIRLATSLHSQRLLRHVIQDICHVLATGCRINRSRKRVRTYQKLQLIQSSKSLT